jgi:hypothetical protein
MDARPPAKPSRGRMNVTPWERLEHFEIEAPTSWLNGVIVGAGLSRAANPASPGWHQLLADIRDKAPEHGLLPGGTTPTDDPFAEALRLSRRSSRRRDARPTAFQTLVAKVLKASWDVPGRAAAEDEPRWRTVGGAFAEFLRAVHASVILDLNYDPCVERLLDGNGIPYVRSVGSEIHSTGILPAGGVLVWKIHGTVAAPSTIVLSPSEYQRMYEINALGTDLRALAEKIDTLWAVGVGLEDDDVWAYLASVRKPLTVHALLINDARDPEAYCRPWLDAFGGHMDRVEVVHRRLDGDSGTRDAILVSSLKTLAKEVIRATAEGPPPPDPWTHVSATLSDRIDEFDKRYTTLFGRTGTDEVNPDVALAVVGEFRNDFTSLRDYFLSFRAGGGRGWRYCPSLRPDSPLDEEDLAQHGTHLAAAIVAAAKECKARLDPDNRRGLLVAAAAQAAVAYVIELADALGVPVEVGATFDPPPKLSKKQAYLVGANPFHAGDVARTNLMHFFQLPERLEMGPPLFRGSDRVQKTWKEMTDAEAPRPPALLSEDEWEATVVHMYRNGAPTIRLGGSEPVDLRRVPPLYPWGFRFLDVKSFRAQNVSQVSRSWHLVAKIVGDSQVLKGGGLRDRSPELFRIGNRGLVRIGEFDEFFQAAYRYPS